MKLRAETPKGTFHIEITGKGYLLTHHRLPTQTIQGDVALFDFLVDPEREVTFQDPHMQDAIVCLHEDTRHSVQGFRGLRYVDGYWDEAYLFFASISEAIEAIQTGNYKAARAAF